MDIDTLINLVMIIFFLIIAMVIQAVKAMQKKKPGKAPEKGSQRTWFPLIQKLKDQFQAYIEHLERQARQAKQQQEAPDPTFWDELTEEDLEEAEDASGADDSKQHDPVQPSWQEIRDKRRGKTDVVTPMPKAVGSWKTPAWVRQHPDLRQAVVWAEIIGKPVALKKDPPGPGL
ncbi:MAG TPA: hypothetical protein VK885_10460 [Desulfotignum sp.]|nr:hypothetical protein [Desulfotignum sp.]